MARCVFLAAVLFGCAVACAHFGTFGSEANFLLATPFVLGTAWCVESAFSKWIDRAAARTG